MTIEHRNNLLQSFLEKTESQSLCWNYIVCKKREALVVTPWCQISFYSLFIVLLNCEQEKQKVTTFYKLS